MELNTLLELCLKNNASDLHISPGQPPIYRIDGELVPSVDCPSNGCRRPTEKLIYSCMTETQRQEFERDWEFDFAIQLPNVAGYRVNAFKQSNGTAAVFRLIPAKIPYAG